VTNRVPYELEWTTDTASNAPTLERREVQSPADLHALLDTLWTETQTGEPVIAELVAPHGASLGIGVGRAWSVAEFKSSPSEPPFYESVGGAELTDVPDDACVFYYQGQWTEVPRETLIPSETAREAMRIFFETGNRPDNLRWKEI
jgi:hypothetical protein